MAGLRYWEVVLVDEYSVDDIIALPIPVFRWSGKADGERIWTLSFAAALTKSELVRLREVAAEYSSNELMFVFEATGNYEVRLTVRSVAHPASDPVMFATQNVLSDSCRILSSSIESIECEPINRWLEAGFISLANKKVPDHVGKLD